MREVAEVGSEARQPTNLPIWGTEPLGLGRAGASGTGLSVGGVSSTVATHTNFVLLTSLKMVTDSELWLDGNNLVQHEITEFGYILFSFSMCTSTWT